MRKLSFNMALSGILSALCIIMLFFVGITPIFLYVFPMLCSYLMYCIYFECGTKFALCSYASVSILSLLICPDKEAVFLYVGFFGYYSVIKWSLDKIKPMLLRLAVKLALFNAVIVGIYWLLISLFKIVSITEFADEGGKVIIWAFLLLADFTFLVYDYAIKKHAFLYEHYLRKKFLRK